MSDDLSESSSDLTQLMRAWQAGDLRARERFFALVYQQVHDIAERNMRKQAQVTLSATELAHESLLRLLGADGAGGNWADRKHFFYVVAQATRQVLIDHARRRLANKRDFGARTDLVECVQNDAQIQDADRDLLGVNDALEALSRNNARHAQIVELTYFGGFEREEIAAALALSVSTIDRDLRFARAWLKDQLSQACKASEETTHD